MLAPNRAAGPHRVDHLLIAEMVKAGARVVAVGQLKLQSGSPVVISTDSPPPIPAQPPRY